MSKPHNRMFNKKCLNRGTKSTWRTSTHINQSNLMRRVCLNYYLYLWVPFKCIFFLSKRLYLPIRKGTLCFKSSIIRFHDENKLKDLFLYRLQCWVGDSVQDETKALRMYSPYGCPGSIALLGGKGLPCPLAGLDGFCTNFFFLWMREVNHHKGHVMVSDHLRS